MPTKKMITLETLLARAMPTSTVDVGGFTFELQAQSSKMLDDLITKYPPSKDKEESFGADMRYELVSLSVVNVDLSVEDVRTLLDTWSRPDVLKLQSAVFDLNWVGPEAATVPLSGTGSDGTPGSPSS